MNASPSPQRLRVVLAANSGYLAGVVVTVHSLLRHLAPDWAADLTLFTDGFDAESEETLRRVAAATGREHTLTFVPVSTEDFRDYPSQPNGSWLTYARLLCPRLIAEDQALYIDADIVVGCDVSRLTELPWEDGCLLYAVRDGNITTVSLWWERMPWRELGIPADAPYLNAGVLWMNLAAWRREGVEVACQQFLRDHPGKVAFHDQTTLNAVLWNRWKPLDRRWNFAPEHTLGRFSLYPLRRVRGANIHYVSRKPWQHVHPWGRYYWDEMRRIAALVPARLLRRPPWQRQAVRQWAFFFTQRAYLHYGGFVKHAVLGALGTKSARRRA